jgi:hypothetical protein
MPPRAWRRFASRVLGRRSKPPSVRVLYPTRDGPSPREYWDLVAHALDRMERPFLSLGLRTDTPGSGVALRVEAVLAALPRHPLARRLAFVNPLDAIDRLLPPPVPARETAPVAASAPAS